MTQPADQGHDRDPPPRHRSVRDLASWWPLISPPEEYAEEAAFADLAAHGRPADSYGSRARERRWQQRLPSQARFEMTLVDLSEDMLAVSRRLNPECEHLLGDMQTLRLGRSFDAVFVHDAIDYMTTEADLRRAVSTAYQHCRVGGVAVFVPDDIAENFEPGTDHGGHDAPDGRGVRYLEWSIDPDPGDTRTRSEFAFLLRASRWHRPGRARYPRLRTVSARGGSRCLSMSGFVPARSPR